MQKIIRTAAIATAFIAGGAQAQVYVEGNYLPTKITDAGSNISYKPSLMTGIVGYGVHPNLALEGVLGFGVRNDTVDDFTVKIKSTYGVYIKPRYQVNEQVEVFARIGYLKNKFSGSDGTTTESTTEGSTAWGVGASFAIDKNLYLTGGYNHLYKKDGVKSTGLNFGVGYKF